jgi:NTE family protein
VVTTAFVLSGGGSLGAVQVGMLQALADRGVVPDLIVGTSAGALNAAYVAGRGMTEPSLATLEEIWRGLRRRDVFPISPLRAIAALAQAAPALCSSGPLRRLITEHLPYDRLEAAVLPVHLVATDACTGEEVLLSSGPAVEAVLASAAIPAVFPSVPIAGRHLVDGGVANNAAISQAVALGADRIYVLPSGYACALDRPPHTALASAMHALTLLIEQRLILEVAAFADTIDLRVLPPLCPLAVASMDFGQAAELIDRARRSTAAWLDSGGTSRIHPERFLSLHDHRRRRTGDVGIEPTRTVSPS